MHKYIIIGPQGSGKGTQARLLCSEFDFVHISIGDIFRWNMQHHTKLAARVKRIMDQGLLVPDDIVEDVVRRRLEEHDWNYGFVLDGFPRTRSQAEYLFERWNLDKAIYLDLPEDVIFERVMYRAKVGDGETFTKRTDDNPEALKVRLKEYHDKTAPLLELFERKGMLVKVDGRPGVQEVHQSVLASLDLRDRHAICMAQSLDSAPSTMVSR
ncbi:MAG: nucleoside monophosphate kinase [Bryobacteraceae bacterium]|nr:nucleoside monophosphate kinase [Bryobacteraceae bacterium]